MFMDKLIEKIMEKNNPIVVGLDPQTYLIPQCIIDQYSKEEEPMGEIFWQFNKAVIDAIEQRVPAVKLQIAFYEQWGIEGLKAYQKTIRYAEEKGLMVIGDIKRGDVFSTAQAYASAHLKGPFECHAVTVNPFMGRDSIEPFLSLCKSKEKGIFALVKTSNPSSGEIQNLVADHKPIYRHLAQRVEKWGQDTLGKYGYSAVGAVVAATYPKEAKELREEMPNTFFLVPGYGAQGGRAEDIIHSFDDRGLGAIVNSSRGILGAYMQHKGKEVTLEEFQQSVITATEKMKKELLQALKENNKYQVYTEEEHQKI